MSRDDGTRAEARTDVVLKLGGGMLHAPGALAAVLATVGDALGARGVPHVVVVPGGGPFADAVREVDRRLDLSDDAAHWMAILAMDQYAHLLADRLPHGRLVDGPAPIATAHREGALPVLAPSRWLRAADPLPHTWDVTSDSIAAWIAGVLGARCLVLVKPPGARGRDDLVDPYFSHAVRQDIPCLVVAADDPAALRSALGVHAVQR
ncbi:MAG TPA: hypothetical protein VGD56_02155 [Gemmatirosa sp.]